MILISDSPALYHISTCRWENVRPALASYRKRLDGALQVHQFVRDLADAEERIELLTHLVSPPSAASSQAVGLTHNSKQQQHKSPSRKRATRAESGGPALPPSVDAAERDVARHGGHSSALHALHQRLQQLQQRSELLGRSNDDSALNARLMSPAQLRFQRVLASWDRLEELFDSRYRKIFSQRSFGSF